MKYIQLFFIFFLPLAVCSAQIPGFQWAVNSNSIGGETAKIITDHSGNIYSYGAFRGNTLTLGTFTLTHGSYNKGGSYGDLYLSKQDASGNFIWAITPNALDSVATTWATALASDASGNLMACLEFTAKNANSAIIFGKDTILPRINGVFAGSGGYKTIVAFNPNGEVIWYKVIYKNSGTGIAFNIGYAVADNNNNFIAGGFFGTNDTLPIVFDTINLPKTNPASASETFLIKFDPNGNVIYAKTIGGPGVDQIGALSADNNGNIYVGCNFSSDTLRADTSYVVNALGGGAFLPLDFAYAKFDANGNAVWLKSIPAGYNAFNQFECAVAAGGELYITGQFKKHSINFGAVTLTSCLFAFKADANGNPLWAVQLGDTVTSGNVLGAAIDALDNLYLVGIFSDDSLHLTSTTFFNAAPGTGTSDQYFIKTDDSGTLIQSFSFGSDGTDRGFPALGNNGTVILSGSFKGPSISFGSITLTNADFPNNDAYWASFNSTTGLSGISRSASIEIYPNPVEENITIKLGYIPDASTSFTISNVAGQKLMEGCISFSASTTLPTDHLKKGIYFIKIEDENGIHTGKFVKL